MINIIVASHGNLAHELVNTAAMIAGHQQGVFSLGLQPDDTPDTLAGRLGDVLQSLDGQDILILVDMLNGTPFNMAARTLHRPNIECVTGVNLPILLEAVLTREDGDVSDLAARLEEAGPQTIRNLRPLLKKPVE